MSTPKLVAHAMGLLTVAAAGDCAAAFRVRDSALAPAHDCAAPAPPTPDAAAAADAAVVPVSVVMALSPRLQCPASPRWQCVVCA